MYCFGLKFGGLGSNWVRGFYYLSCDIFRLLFLDFLSRNGMVGVDPGVLILCYPSLFLSVFRSVVYYLRYMGLTRGLVYFDVYID